jgi:hypothetical protein
MLRKHLETIHERAVNPGPYVRPSQNYTSSGYGFEAEHVSDNLVLTASYNEYCAADGEVEDASVTEWAAFKCFRTLGLLTKPR